MEKRVTDPIQVPSTRLRKAYDYLRENDVVVPEDYSIFEEQMQEEEKLTKLYDYFKAQEVVVPEDFTAFKSGMLEGLKKKELGIKSSGTGLPDVNPYQQILPAQPAAIPLEEVNVTGDAGLQEDPAFTGPAPQGNYMSKAGKAVPVPAESSFTPVSQLGTLIGTQEANPQPERNVAQTFQKSVKDYFTNTLPTSLKAFAGAITSPYSTGMNSTGMPSLGAANPFMQASTPQELKSTVKEQEAAVTELKKSLFKDILASQEMSKDLNLIQSYKQVNDPIDALNLAVRYGTQGVAQLGTTLLTAGTSSFGESIGQDYIQQVQEIAAKNYITPEEVITKGLDNPALSLAFGSFVGAVDMLSGKTVGKQVAKAFTNSVRKRALNFLVDVGKEAGTEVVQGGLTDVSTGLAAGKSASEITTDVLNPENRINDALGGLLGAGTILGGSRLAGRVASIRQLNQAAPDTETTTISPTAEAEENLFADEPNVNAPEAPTTTASAKPSIEEIEAQINQLPSTDFFAQNKPKVTNPIAVIPDEVNTVFDKIESGLYLTEDQMYTADKWARTSKVALLQNESIAPEEKKATLDLLNGFLEDIDVANNEYQQAISDIDNGGTTTTPNTVPADAARTNALLNTQSDEAAGTHPMSAVLAVPISPANQPKGKKKNRAYTVPKKFVTDLEQDNSPVVITSKEVRYKSRETVKSRLDNLVLTSGYDQLLSTPAGTVLQNDKGDTFPLKLAAEKSYARYLLDKVKSSGITKADQMNAGVRAPINTPVSFENGEGVRRTGTVVKENADGTVDIKAENNRIHSKVKVEATILQSPLEDKINQLTQRSASQSNIPVKTSGFFGKATIPVAKTNQNNTAASFEFSRQEVEERFKQAAATMPVQPGWMSKSYADVKDILVKFSRKFPHLDARKFGDTANKLRVFQGLSDYSKTKAEQYVRGVLSPLTVEQKELVTRRIILEDILTGLNKGQEQEGNLPFGLQSRQEVEDSLAQIENLMQQEPAAQEAYTARQDFMQSLYQQLVDSKLLSSQEGDYQTYYHRRVLEYQQEESKSNILHGKRIGKVKRDFQKKRTGSAGKDFSTNFVESEFKVVADGLFELKKKELLDNLLAPYVRQMEMLKDLAKQAYKTNLQEAEDLFPDDITLADHIRQNKREFIAQYMKENAPEGYVLWQPESGNVLFKSQMASQAAMEQAVEQAAMSSEDVAGQSLQLAENLLTSVRNILVQGGKKKEYLIPEELALTLDELGAKVNKPAGFSKLIQDITASWKVWVLMSPTRILKYNLNNAVGDLDGTIAVDPGILTQSRTAWTELQDYLKTGKVTTRLNEALEQGVIGSGLSIKEFRDINNLDWVQYFRGKKKATISDLFKTNPLEKGLSSYLDFVQKYTNMRENWLRYSAYLRAKELLAKGEQVYWASNKTEINQITDSKEKAGKLAREALGDYGNLSVSGETLRRNLLPFYSWLEINMKRYYNLIKNAPDSTASTRITAMLLKKGITKTAFKTVNAYAKMAALSAGVAAWNHFQFPDEDEELAKTETKGLQLIIGRNADGTIKTLPIVGAFYDFLDFFGIPDINEEVAEILQGNNVSANAREAAKEVPESMASKIITGVTPLIKTPVELITRRQFFPKPFSPRPLTDRRQYLANMLTVPDLYKELTGKPMRNSYFSTATLSNLLTRNVDIKEAAYYDVLSKIREYKGGSSFEQGEDETNLPKRQALAYFTTSMRFHDVDKANTYLEEYFQLGGTRQGLIASIRARNPLHSLSKEEKQEMHDMLKGKPAVTAFGKKFTAKDLEEVRLALEYYTESYSVEGDKTKK